MAKGGKQFWTHRIGEGAKNLRLDLNFLRCVNNLYMFLSYYRHFRFFEFRGEKEFGRKQFWTYREGGGGENNFILNFLLA